MPAPTCSDLRRLAGLDPACHPPRAHIAPALTSGSSGISTLTRHLCSADPAGAADAPPTQAHPAHWCRNGQLAARHDEGSVVVVAETAKGAHFRHADRAPDKIIAHAKASTTQAMLDLMR